MKQSTHIRVVSRASLAMIMGLAIWSPLQLQSAEHASEKMMMEGKMPERHKAMQEQHQRILAEMKAQDVELTAELAKIKSAPADKKMDLLIAVVNRMVEQRTAMHQRMGEMMNQMMEYKMMDHGAVSSNPTKVDITEIEYLSIAKNPEKLKF